MFNKIVTANFSENIIDERMQERYKPDIILAEIQASTKSIVVRLADVPTVEKLEKLVEDVK